MKKWYCIHTKPKKEDMVEQKLLGLPSIEIFNPKIQIKKYMRSRLVQSIEALFPSYLFARFENPGHFHMIKYTQGVRGFVGDSNGFPFSVDDGVIELIQSRIKDGYVRLEPAPRIVPGDTVKILEGPLKGLPGILLTETRASERVMILLNTMQYQSTARIPNHMVAKA